MDTITHEIRRIQEALRGGHISQRELARLAGIRDTTLIGCMEDTWNPTARTLRALSMALDSIGFFSKPHVPSDAATVAA